LTLLGAGGAGAPANSRPEVLIALKGPVDAPRRSIDVAALASWLALRAVEQQSKRLDVLEGRDPAASPARPASNVDKQTAPAAERAPAAGPAAPDAAPGEAAAPRSQPTSAQKPTPAAPAAERAPVLPPPIDIRPAPAPRAPRVQPGAQGAPAQPQKPAAAAAPPRPRSLAEILFGR
jgi:large subunit ribosomal protein L24